jgi:hypothetical protein
LRACGCPGQSGEDKIAEGRPSFLKKRSKKLLDIWLRLFRRGSAQDSKVFCFFFSKKKSFLYPVALIAL